MGYISQHRRARATFVIAIALAGGAGSIAQASLAHGAPPTVNAIVSGAPHILAGVHETLQGLVARGIISQQQADAVEQQANTGSVEPRDLVQRGVLSDAQMRAVSDQLDQLKQAAGK